MRAHAIAVENEGPLHAALKAWYAREGDLVEHPLSGSQIDLVRGDLLIEIQTGGFAPLKKKLERLIDAYRVRVVHPVPLEKWIVRIDDEGRVLGRRRSPLRGRAIDVFEHLVALPTLLTHPHFSLEILLTHEEEVRRYEPGRARRRNGWVIVERRLVDVKACVVVDVAAQLIALAGARALPAAFTTADLAEAADVNRDLAQKVAYCWRAAGLVCAVGKRKGAVVYERVTPG
jgi:hypothetical protein